MLEAGISIGKVSADSSKVGKGGPANHQLQHCTGEIRSNEYHRRP